MIHGPRAPNGSSITHLAVVPPAPMQTVPSPPHADSAPTYAGTCKILNIAICRMIHLVYPKFRQCIKG